jgi:hypothetical protein
MKDENNKSLFFFSPSLDRRQEDFFVENAALSLSVSFDL